MANPEIQLYNFYRRYRWTEDDFAGWQEGMVDHSRGMFDGLFHGGVLLGYDVASGNTLAVNVSEGIASGPSGYLHVIDEVTEVSIDAATGTVRRDLIVVRPNLVDNTYITRPTNPFETVPLRTAQESAIVVLKGVEANAPEYPATEANDVVLCGVRVVLGQTSIPYNSLDFEVRDVLGKNSNFQQDAAKYDDRLRPYRSTASVLGIKPSQLEPPFARVFSYVAKTGPSIFPKNASGNYNPADTFLNFQTGAITGGDEVSANFTPEIPTAGNCIVACVSILTDDTVVVTFGDEGTREECFSGVKNQDLAGPGSLTITANSKPIAFVIVSSKDGANVTEIDFFDCRGVFGVGESSSGVAGEGVTTPAGGLYPLTLDSSYDGKVINVNSSSARTINAAALTAGFKFTVKDYQGNSNTNNITFVPAGAQQLEGLNANYIMNSDYGSWTWLFDGTNWFLI